MKTITSAIALAFLTASQAFAQQAGVICTNPLDPKTCGPTTAVPEISALEGTAALAALAAIVLIAWERRRRAV